MENMESRKERKELDAYAGRTTHDSVQQSDSEVVTKTVTNCGCALDGPARVRSERETECGSKVPSYTSDDENDVHEKRQRELKELKVNSAYIGTYSVWYQR